MCRSGRWNYKEGERVRGEENEMKEGGGGETRDGRCGIERGWVEMGMREREVRREGKRERCREG